MTRSGGRISKLLLSFIVLVLVLAVFALAFKIGKEQGGGGVLTALEAAVQKSQLAFTMQESLSSAVTEEKSAVVAETDESFKELVEEAKRSTAAVETARRELARLIETSGRPDEVESLAGFNECWTKYQEVDRELLALGVENTKLKAQQLAFVPPGEALERMQSTLEPVISDASSDGTLKPAYRAMTAALRIHALEGRHIAEARDEEMEKIEAMMTALDTQVGDAFTAMAAAASEAMKPNVDAARLAYADFQKVNSEVISLSRRNSNVRSLAMSLGQKRTVTAECQGRLTSLQEALRRDVGGATR